MKRIKLNEIGGQSRSVMIETKHGKIEVFCNSDYVAIELHKVHVAKECFQPVFIEMCGKVLLNDKQLRLKLRRKDSITMGETASDSEKKALVDEWIAAKQKAV